MKKYEYKNSSILMQPGGAEESKFLNQQGLLGWQLVSVLPSTHPGSNWCIYYFKRELA